MDKQKIYILGEMPVFKAISNLALPTVLSMIVQILYNLTDTFFVGMLNDHYQIAAVTITMPVFMMLMSISGVFGNGGASFLSRLLGNKQYKTADKAAATSFYSVALMGVLTTILGLLLINPILKECGASINTYPYAKAYLQIILGGSIITLFNFALSQLLRAEGAAKYAMYGMFIGTGVNIVLDPVFIIYLHMGVRGAAIATIIGNGLATLYYLRYYLTKRSLISLSWEYFTPTWFIYRNILKIGIPSSLSQIMMSVGSAISYQIASGYSDISVAGLGIVSRVFSIAIFIFIGLAIGIQPLIGYSYGAKNYLRLKHTVNYSIIIVLVLTVFFILLFAIFPHALIMAFSKNPDVINVGVIILRSYLIAVPFAGLQMIFGVALQAMGKGTASLIVSLSRQGLVYIPAIYILNYYFGFRGMVFALPLADIMTTIIAFAFFFKIMTHLERKTPTV